MFDLTGKVAVITGSTKGIGKAIALQMAKAGAKVVISSRKAEACEAVAEEISTAGGEAISLPCNISHLDQMQALVEGTFSKWGRIDCLVCNAAVNPYYGPFIDTPDEAFAKTMQVNVRSNILLAKLVLPQMIERRDGSIIIISSIAGLRGQTFSAPTPSPKRPTCKSRETSRSRTENTTSGSTVSLPDWSKRISPGHCGKTRNGSSRCCALTLCHVWASRKTFPAPRFFSPLVQALG